MVKGLDKHAKYEILEAIRRAEEGTSGEVRVHVKPRCAEDVMGQAQKVFRRLGMHRTKQRNAVLVFVATDSRRFAIVGDKDIHGKVGDAFWERARDTMQEHFSKGDITGGIVAGVQRVGERLKEHYPAHGENPDELSNQISEDRK